MNDPMVRFAGDRPYTDSFEYVEELSVFVDLRILEKLQDRLELLDVHEMTSVSGNVAGTGIKDAGESAQTNIQPGMNAVFEMYSGDNDRRAVRYLKRRLRIKNLTEGQTAEKWAQQIVSRREISEAAGRSLALDIVIEKLSLPEWMTEVLIYYYNTFLDRDYAAVIGAQSLYDVLCLLFEDDTISTARISAMLSSAASQIGYIFPECDGTTDILHTTVQMDIRLYELIIGGADAPTQDTLDGFQTLRQLMTYSESKHSKSLPYGLHELENVTAYADADISVYAYMYEYADKLRHRFTDASSGAVVLWGSDGVGKHTLASCIFEKLGKPVLEYDAGECAGEASVSGSISSLMDHTLYTIRECMVTNHALVVSGLEKYAPEQQKLFMGWIVGKSRQTIGTVCVLIEAEAVPDYLEGAYLFGLKVPDAITRAGIWKHYFKDGLTQSQHIQISDEENAGNPLLNQNPGLEAAAAKCKSHGQIRLLPDEKIQQLANSFALTPGQIKRAAEQAFLSEEPITRDDSAPNNSVKCDDDEAGEIEQEPRFIPALTNLYRCCYAVMGHPLKDHTQKVESPFKWDDIKMDPKDKGLLRDVCDTVRNRHIVMQEWNFESKVPYGAGVTVLFAGPPGTGKTMAAQVIANELGMELYKIDLSQLIDKYVGETEKNIRNVFDQARKSNSVLFFDEADAIFNKRMDAKDANERFANIESSLLLQCIEEFDGISILATNNMNAIDNAFLRRFRYYLLFKEPDENIRYEIWKSVFPKQAPVADEVDFHELARIFKFTGAIIKNVALTSAYLAAAQGTPIGLLEIMIAIKREMEKNHRLLTKEEMGSLGYLFARVSER